MLLCSELGSGTHTVFWPGLGPCGRFAQFLWLSVGGDVGAKRCESEGHLISTELTSVVSILLVVGALVHWDPRTDGTSACFVPEESL